MSYYPLKSRTPISETSLHDEFKRYVELVGLDVKEVNMHRLDIHLEQMRLKVAWISGGSRVDGAY